jgi:peptidoglycan/xylan/chitin deacetylase (PgdA/CDA1 family)
MKEEKFITYILIGKIMKFISHFFVLIVFILGFSNVLHAEEVAITMDDPNCGPPIFYTHKVRDEKILAALKKNHLKAVLFVHGMCVDNAEGVKLLQRWNSAGHTLGNHTYSHININEIGVEKDAADTLRNEKILQPYTHFKKIFRFPFLKEGDTLATRDAFRKFLHAHHYKFGSVTIDASDWYISNRLEDKLAQNPNVDLAPYKKYYLEHMWNRAQYYDNLAKKVLGRSPKHTLLIHHNLLNALFLDDLIKMFKDKGWKVIDADVAFRDPIFKMTPNTLPAGESLIWALAKETGRYDNQLHYPGEDESYEKKAMDKLGL